MDETVLGPGAGDDDGSVATAVVVAIMERKDELVAVRSEDVVMVTGGGWGGKVGMDDIGAKVDDDDDAPRGGAGPNPTLPIVTIVLPAPGGHTWMMMMLTANGAGTDRTVT